MEKMKFLRSIGILISLLLTSFVFVEGGKRSLSAVLNPNCPTTVCPPNEDDKITLIHIKADGDNDTLHYIWDLTRQPTVLVALCERGTNVTIQWDKLLKDAGAVNFTTKPKYTMSFVLTKVFIFDDVKDKATIIGLNDSYIDTIDTKNITWNRENYNATSSEVEVTVNGTNDILIGHEGVINLKLKCFGDENHDSSIPHLLHSVNVTQVDMEFYDVTSNSSFRSPRIAAEFVLLASESTKNPFTISKRKTVDDEHTPGIFRLVDIISPNGRNGTQGSYLQYRPISYTDESRDISTKTDIKLNEPSFLVNPKSYINSSLVSSFNGDSLNKYLVQSFNISFGETEDRFYSHTNYTTWTFILGFGTAPPERVSMFIAILACIAMGIPLLLLIIGGVYLAVKRMRNC